MISDISDKIKGGCLVTSGTKDSFNTMTIGWGMIGNIYRKETFIAYIRHNRYTFSFMEKNDCFTVSFYDSRYKDAIKYLGTTSGKDRDKVKESGLSPVDLAGGVTFKEAYLTLVCRKFYWEDINLKMLPPEVREHYYSDDVPHRAYYGEIVKVIAKEREEDEKI